MFRFCYLFGQNQKFYGQNLLWPKRNSELDAKLTIHILFFAITSNFLPEHLTKVFKFCRFSDKIYSLKSFENLKFHGAFAWEVHFSFFDRRHRYFCFLSKVQQVAINFAKLFKSFIILSLRHRQSQSHLLFDNQQYFSTTRHQLFWDFPNFWRWSQLSWRFSAAIFFKNTTSIDFTILSTFGPDRNWCVAV